MMRRYFNKYQPKNMDEGLRPGLVHLNYSELLSMRFFQCRDRYVVVDCGGGTVDISAQQLLGSYSGLSDLGADCEEVESDSGDSSEEQPVVIAEEFETGRHQQAQVSVIDSKEPVKSAFGDPDERKLDLAQKPSKSRTAGRGIAEIFFPTGEWPYLRNKAQNLISQVVPGVLVK